MGLDATFDPQTWARVPFHFWSVTFFLFGTMVGSFLNVCIHRMPIGESIVSPPSHCPHCRYSIPWFLNIPLATWLYLRGQCANCGAPISMRYFLVELLTGLMFLGCWLTFGHQSAWLALVYCVLLAGFIVATFIDFAHFIIPDEITIGGMVVGFICSFAVPALHGQTSPAPSLGASLWGMLAGGGVIYAILRAGKLALGRRKVELPAGSKVIFTESALVLPTEAIPYEELFYRESDTVKFEAERVELCDRCYGAVTVRVRPSLLIIGEEEIDPETVPHLEATTGLVVLPREAMGLGDVKFMAAIGAFLGWQGVLFSLMASSFLGATVGVTLIALKRRDRSSLIPYGPYIALAATIWVFGQEPIRHFARMWFTR